MKRSEVAELVAIMAAAFIRPPMTEKTCQVYETMLADLEHGAAKRAVMRLVNTSKWLPTIAEIRAAAVELEHGARRSGAEAWGDVTTAIRKIGRYGNPAFEDPLVAQCVRSFGWETLCDSTNDTADRARFIEAFDALAERSRRDLVAGAALALPSPNGAKQLEEKPKRSLQAVPGFSDIGRKIGGP